MCNINRFTYSSFVGEISSPIPANFKIPLKSSETQNGPTNQYNPMEYYPSPPTTDRVLSPQKTTPISQKRKLDKGGPTFYSSESLRCTFTTNVEN